jgi:putative iron-regulated protein
LGVRNVYAGRYVRVDGSVVSGPSLHDLVSKRDPAVASALMNDLNTTMMALGAIRDVAEAGTSYDQMLVPGAPGGALIQAGIDGLVAQTRNIERAVALVGLDGVSVEGSDSLDNPNAVFE